MRGKHEFKASESPKHVLDRQALLRVPLGQHLPDGAVALPRLLAESRHNAEKNRPDRYVPPDELALEGKLRFRMDDLDVREARMHLGHTRPWQRVRRLPRQGSGVYRGRVCHAERAKCEAAGE